MDAFYAYPSYYDVIIGNLIDRDWLVHNFNGVEGSEIYNFSNYLYNKEFKGFTYTIYLDLNIYQYIISAFKKANPNSVYRDAIGLIAFCQLSKIELDPTLAVYEKLNYRTDTETLDEVVSDLELFHRINNINNETLISYSLGERNDIIIPESYPIERELVKKDLTKYRRLTEWDSLYLIVLFIIYTSLNKESSKIEKFQTVVEWMIQEFRLSLVCITFAAIFFSDKPLKKMMKYKASSNSDLKRRSAFNMTWDLYNLNRYFRMWTERESKQEGMFASGDKAFNAILRNSINVQKNGNLSCFSEFLPVNVIEYIEKITSKPDSHVKRIYSSDLWTPDYRLKQIEKYELLIGIR
ncbi:conserved hypothetical protein [Ferrimonas balearica DSM 9799]|uniref:Uncharacterized protein n=1 Tax=Ferrimonas balearica (strain DSM 9799 / CCM 4581 / KCTC 23876 / PAT) TaxID=550540 RepID=E1SPZ0_FERBD|nr:hypothetical protein [Ferrimonas balearica]ADN75785.1 conserved hypothetical protein [Ferrimonas balearica DSM 9799]